MKDIGFVTAEDVGYSRSSFDEANAYGRQGELFVFDLLTHLRDGAGSWEAKRKTRKDSQFYIEVQKLSYGRWVPSGLMVSQATVWFFVVADTECAAVFPADRLRAAVRAAEAAGRLLFEIKSATQPTKGYVLSWSDILTP